MMNLRSDFTNDHVPSGMKNGNTCRPMYPEFSPTHSYNGCVHETLHTCNAFQLSVSRLFALNIQTEDTNRNT